MNNNDIKQLELFNTYIELKQYKKCKRCNKVFKGSKKRLFCDTCIAIKKKLSSINSTKITNKDNGIKKYERFKYEKRKS